MNTIFTIIYFLVLVPFAFSVWMRRGEFLTNTRVAIYTAAVVAVWPLSVLVVILAVRFPTVNSLVGKVEQWVIGDE